MKLRPGDILTWREPGMDEQDYILFYLLYRQFQRSHGEKVEFVGYADKSVPFVLHTHDTKGLPILQVRTKAGVVVFSADYFLC